VNLDEIAARLPRTPHPEVVSLYAQLIGELMFIAINTQPLIAQPVNAPARFMTTANSELLLAKEVLRYLIAQPVNALARFMTIANSELLLAKEVLRYLKGVKSRKIIWCASRVKFPFVPCEIYAYSDASWADIVPQCKSSLSYLIFCNNVFSSWKASLSAVLAISSAEAELIALCAYAADVATVVNSQTNLVSCNCALPLFMKIIWVLSRLQNREISKDAQNTSSYAGDFSITTSIGAS
jgi:hypothetical protein